VCVGVGGCEWMGVVRIFRHTTAPDLIIYWKIRACCISSQY